MHLPNLIIVKHNSHWLYLFLLKHKYHGRDFLGRGFKHQIVVVFFLKGIFLSNDFGSVAIILFFDTPLVCPWDLNDISIKVSMQFLGLA